MASHKQPSLLRFYFLNLCWIAFLFSLIRVCNSDPGDEASAPGTYAKNAALDGKQVTFFWTLSNDTISIKAKAEKKSGYLAIGFGTGMVNSFAYVGWFDATGKGKVNTYWIDGKDPEDIHATKENLTKVSSTSEKGIVTFEFTRVLDPSCDPGVKTECANIIDPKKPLKVIWAMGPEWSEDKLGKSNMHVSNSKNPTAVMLMEGTSKADDGLPLPFVVHGILMFLAWGLILPAGIFCARYLKHFGGETWFQLHLYLQYSGLAIVVIAFIFVVGTMKVLVFDNLHVKFGYLAIFLGVVQPINAFFRPPKPPSWDEPSSKRIMWEYIHLIGGRCSIIVAFAALITGLRYVSLKNVNVLTYLFIAWICICVIILIYSEISRRRRKRQEIINEMGKAELVSDEFRIVV